MPLNDFDDLIKPTSLKRPISKIAYLMAKITLNFNIAVNEFIELYKFHVATLAKKQNPKHSIVEIAARTGLDRRYVSKTLQDEELKRTNSKIDLVLDKIRQVCRNNHSQHIAKYGQNNSFDSICQQASSGTLTSKSIANELLRRGEIEDKERKFRVVNINIMPEYVQTKFIKEIRDILYSIQGICKNNNTKLIAKSGKNNSFASLCKANLSDSSYTDEVEKFLLKRKYLFDVGNDFEINKPKYMIFSKNMDEYLYLLSIQLSILTETILWNFKAKNIEDEQYQMKYFSTQLSHKSCINLRQVLRKKLKTFSSEIIRILEQYEEDVPLNTYPEFGVSVFLFDRSIVTG